MFRNLPASLFKGVAVPVRLVIVLMAAIVALRMASFLVASQLFHDNLLSVPEFGLVRHLDGTVPRPFAYRVMADWLVRLTLQVGLPGVPVPYLDPIARLAWHAQHVLPAARYDQVKAYVLVATVFAWGFLVATYAAAWRSFGNVLWAAATTLLGALLVNALLLHGASQPYDFLTLFFSTVLFLAAVRQSDVVFTLLLPLALLSKESLVLFVPVYAAIAYENPAAGCLFRNFGIQAGIFLVVYGWQLSHFALNPGAPMYHDLSGHVRYILDYADPRAVLASIVTGILLFYRLKLKPRALRRAMLVLPLLAALYVLGGSPGEFRIVFEVFPIVLLAVSDTLLRLITGRDPPDLLSRPARALSGHPLPSAPDRR